VNGFEGDVIHPFNKNEHAIEKSDYFQVSTADCLLHTLVTSVCNFSWCSLTCDYLFWHVLFTYNVP
jgi:hypothetical protein